MGWGTNVGDISFECCHLRITSSLLSASMPEVSMGGRAKGGWEPRVRSTLEGGFGEPLPTGERKDHALITINSGYYRTSLSQCLLNGTLGY